MLYTKLFLRFIKEHNLYHQIIQPFSHIQYIYDGCIEDKLSREYTTVSNLFPMPCMGTYASNTKKMWSKFLKENNVRSNFIPNPSENWNDVPDKLFDEFYLIYKDNNFFKKAFDEVNKNRIIYKGICRYLRLKKIVIDDLFGKYSEVKYTWINYLYNNKIKAIWY